MQVHVKIYEVERQRHNKQINYTQDSSSFFFLSLCTLENIIVNESHTEWKFNPMNLLALIKMPVLVHTIQHVAMCRKDHVGLPSFQ